ncbi:alpha/beta hydrolase [Flammeovirga sp. SubArs3]|uniref:alpha/beta fold hydrolase n=1 Tax=Flammeovirga sp. SubArs3 TaxID=2995316 RepID=UPI00248ACD6C|nr:alpha/beta hydrolase [Flammeovirga sp. SubArs3]
MIDEKKLSTINLYDRFNAAFVSLITPEMSELNKIRKQNGYSHQPTIEKPFDMPLEFTSIDGVKIRMAKSIIDLQEKETVVLLSAFPHSIIAYSTVWEQLKNNYNLFAYDLPGFGASEGKSDYMSFKFQGSFLNSFLKHFDIESSHLVGPDVGMPSALTYVIHHKHKIKSLMIGDGPAALPTSEPSVMKKMVHSGFWRTMFVIAGSGALIESAKNLGNVQYVPNKFEISDYKKSHTGKVANNMKWFKKYPDAVKDIDENLKNITIPTKIFWGEHEAILHKENGIRLNQRLPNSELEIFENCGHFVYQDDYKRFIRLIESWVEKHK